MNYIFSLLSFSLLSFLLVFDSMAVFDGNEVLSMESAMSPSYVRTKRALIPLTQENSLPTSPSKKARMIESEGPPESENDAPTQLSRDFLVNFARCLSPCTEVLEDLDDDVPPLSTPSARYNPFVRLNAIAAMKLQENIYGIAGIVRQKWHLNIYNSTLMLPDTFTCF